MSKQFVVKTPLTDRKIWNYMLQGVYGSQHQQYAQHWEEVAKQHKQNPRSRKSVDERAEELLGELL